MSENVWGYPRPPAVEPCLRHVRAELAGEILADSDHALRVLETSHPPTIYVPPDDVMVDHLVASRRRSTFCEFKGAARYLDALIGNQQWVRRHAEALGVGRPRQEAALRPAAADGLGA